MNQAWLNKHQQHLPCAVLMFLPLSADPNTSSLLDNKVKSEINAAKAALLTANYKTRLVCVLLGDEEIDAEDVEERITTMRRSTGLDNKTLVVVPYGSDSGHAGQIIQSVLGSLYPQCVEYYRDLSKHARRKRNRNATPQPTIPPATAHVLPSQGWVVRYEFKLGVFAEFRQEMDAAYRSYETAYESLFAAEMIEAIASWSPRFNEARLLADVIAVRILRCLLWTGQTTAAVRAWTGHRERIESFLDRRGKGTENYGWEAWQSLWSKTMSDLLTRSEIAGLRLPIAGSDESPSIYVDAEKSSTERFTPWERLHHQGYWLRHAQEYTKARRKLAAEVPEEDRQPPGRSPASKITQNAESYDTYLTLEPHQELPVDGTEGFDYTSDILATLDAATAHFAERHQIRMNELLQLKRATELLRAKSWSEASEVLQQLWQSPMWRQAGWWKLLEHVGWALLDCALETSAADLIARLTWELGNQRFSGRPDAKFDMDKALQQRQPDGKLSIAMISQDTASRVSASFAFSSGKGHVGEPMDCQLVLSSCSRPEAPPVTLSGIKVVFEGSLKPVYLHHLGGVSSDALLRAVDIELTESSPTSPSANKRSSMGHIASVSGQTDLRLGSGETRILNFQAIPREAGDVTVASITMMIETELLSLTITDSDIEQERQVWWETKGENPFPRPIGPIRVASHLHVLPKPPKVEINAIDFKKSYYTNEEVRLDIEIANHEDEAVKASVAARLISPVVGAARIEWADQTQEEQTEAVDAEQILPQRHLQDLQVSDKQVLSLRLSQTAAALDHELEIVVSYHLESGSESVVQKSLTLDIAVVRPFEANYDFTPRLTSEPWPDYFSAPTSGPEVPSGLVQQYLVTANLFSFALEPIDIEAILLTTTKITGGAIASSTTGVLKADESQTAGDATAAISTAIAPEQTRSFNFDLTIQKQVLGDRNAVALDLSLEIGWRRPGSDRVNSSVLEVPRFVVPMAEPRVLLTLGKKVELPGQGDMSVVSLHYTVENPSMHFLTFNVGMEASEDFAFSGPKASAVSLVPISKFEMSYRILPNKRDTESSRERKKDREVQGEWLKVQLNVVDAYFNQTLRVQPAGEGVRLDKKGGIVVLVD
jgi:trafficking protein particle complex subunit 11